MKTPKKEIKQAVIRKELGTVRVSYYRNDNKNTKGTLNLMLNAETYTYLNKPLRIKLVNIWVSHDLLCLQVMEAVDDEGYALTASNNPTTPYWAAVYNVASEFAKHNISPFAVVRAAVIGSAPQANGQKWVVIGIKIDQLKPPASRGKRKEVAKTPVETSYMMIQALRTLATESVPQTNEAVSTLRRAINQLVKPMDLQLSINEDGLLEVSRVTLKKL